VALLTILALCAHEIRAASTARRGFNVTVHSASRVEMGAVAKSAKITSPGTARASFNVSNALTIRAPAVGGYTLRLEIIDPAVTAIDVHGLPGHVHLTGGVAEVFVPAGASGDQGELTLSYLVTYGDGVLPPERPTPLRVTFAP